MRETRSPCGSASAMAMAVLAATMLASCAARPIVPVAPERIAPSVLVPAAQGGIIDGRGRFREIFKDVLTAQCSRVPKDASCDDGATLWRLAGEPAASGKPVPSGPSPGGFRVVIVPGFLAECVSDVSTAFGDGRGRLEEIGYRTEYIQTRGRKGSGFNADLIRDAVMGMPDGERLIFVTHSKGTVDTLEALVKVPAIAERTAAVVSVSGAVNGSPLAEALPEFLYRLAEKMPMPFCPPGEGIEALESLHRNVRIAWLSTHPLPKNVRLYSLAAFTTRENISRILRPFHDVLARTEPLNDGMVICSDAIVPGSVLLGYPNADHLAVAMPFDRQTSPVLTALIDRNSYPRAALLEAAVRFVEEDLGQTGQPALAPRGEDLRN